MKLILKYSLLTLCFILFKTTVVFSQTTSVTVLSAKDSTAIKEVSFFSLNLKEIYYTNKKGKVNFEIDSSAIFKIFKQEFYSKTIQLKKGQSVTIYLDPFDFLLEGVTIEDEYRKGKITQAYLRKVEKMFVYHAKKSERIKVGDKDANLATNNTRQIYNKIAGLNSFETSSSGLGTEIGVRGLSPERSSNLNVRQNGYDISADALGYPDAYYVPPSQSIDVIEAVRGSGVLQYGTQFGGMVNYRLKKCDFKENKIGFETVKTIGSYQFNNSYNALYGKINKFNFYSFLSYKSGNDWKTNSNFNSRNLFFQGEYKFNSQLSLNFEFMHFYYLAKQPGGLTDAMFKDDPSQSIRDRNWFNVNWNLPSISLKWNKDNNTEMETTFFGLIANRKALGFLGNITRVDPMENRDLLIDNYLNIGNETKLLKRYSLFKHNNVSIFGLRFYRGNTQKRQGEGNELSTPDFIYNIPKNLEGSDYKFPNYNLALFGENIFYFSKKMSFIFGARAEKISTNANGYYRLINRDLAGNILLDTAFIENKNKTRNFILFSVGYSYEMNKKIQLYANFSQNYRAINFNDLRINNSNFRVDPNLKDETGYNMDIGVRGTLKNIFSYDVSLFYLRYNNRIGFVLKTDPTLFNIYRFRTNISKSQNIGIESVIELDIFKLFKNISTDYSLSTFVNVSYIDGRYIGSDEPAYVNKKVELVPSILLKTGISATLKSFSFSAQFSYTGEQYTDATNSEFSPNAISGIIPSYYVLDFSTAYEWKHIKIEGSINNLTNNIYFSKRAVGYPGPGIIAAPPRMIYLTIGVKL